MARSVSPLDLASLVSSRSASPVSPNSPVFPAIPRHRPFSSTLPTHHRQLQVPRLEQTAQTRANVVGPNAYVGTWLNHIPVPPVPSPAPSHPPRTTCANLQQEQQQQQQHHDRLQDIAPARANVVGTNAYVGTWLNHIPLPHRDEGREARREGAQLRSMVAAPAPLFHARRPAAGPDSTTCWPGRELERGPFPDPTPRTERDARGCWSRHGWWILWTSLAVGLVVGIVLIVVFTLG